MTELSNEAKLIAAMKNGAPGNRVAAIWTLALMMAGGRVKVPSVVSTKPKKDGGIAAF